MNIDYLLKLYSEEERECWQFTEYIKHNPVLYPRVGDIFLKELFALANPDKKMPYNRRKKIQMDTVWYKRSKASLATYVLGCETARMLGCDTDIYLENGQRIPFYAIFYLTCLFLGEAQELSVKELTSEMVSKLKKEKEVKGICKPDCRRYFKAVGVNVEHVASDFPLSKHFCPLQQEYECEVECSKQLKVGNEIFTKGIVNFRQREELLFFSTTQRRQLPKGILAGELLCQFLTTEYKGFADSLKDDNMTAETEINCQLLAVFAFLTDCLNGLTWMKLLLSQNLGVEKLKEMFQKEGLWQLTELVSERKWNTNNPLLFVLMIGEALNPFALGEKQECIDFEFDIPGKKITISTNDNTKGEMDALLDYKQSIYKLKEFLINSDITIECTI
ncbi:MAG: hypothetical protein IJW63_10175 [Lachnospiraceae bacterium]|nr:hypothetical protein [Lachnospiraceae bacterium]